MVNICIKIIMINIIFMYLFLSYLANLCWDGGCINFIILRRVKQKAPSPPCDVSASVGTVENQQHHRDDSKCSDHSENHRPTRTSGFTPGAAFAQDKNTDLNCYGDHKSSVLTDSGDHGGSTTRTAWAQSRMKKSHIDSFFSETPRQVRCDGSLTLWFVERYSRSSSDHCN